MQIKATVKNHVYHHTGKNLKGDLSVDEDAGCWDPPRFCGVRKLGHHLGILLFSIS